MLLKYILLIIISGFSLTGFSQEKEIYTKKTVIKQTSVLLLTIFVFILMARGGFSKKPIGIVDAINYSSIGNSAGLCFHVPSVF